MTGHRRGPTVLFMVKPSALWTGYVAWTLAVSAILSLGGALPCGRQPHQKQRSDDAHDADECPEPESRKRPERLGLWQAECSQPERIVSWCRKLVRNHVCPPDDEAIGRMHVAARLDDRYAVDGFPIGELADGALLGRAISIGPVPAEQHPATLGPKPELGVHGGGGQRVTRQNGVGLSFTECLGSFANDPDVLKVEQVVSVNIEGQDGKIATGNDQARLSRRDTA